MRNMVGAGAQILAKFIAMNMSIRVDSRHRGKCWEYIFMMLAFYGNFFHYYVCSTTKYDNNVILTLFVKFYPYFIVGIYTPNKKINRPRAIILALIEFLKKGIETPVVLLRTSATLCDGMNLMYPKIIDEFPLLENGGEGWRLQNGDKANGLSSFPANTKCVA